MRFWWRGNTHRQDELLFKQTLLQAVFHTSLSKQVMWLALSKEDTEQAAVWCDRGKQAFADQNAIYKGFALGWMMSWMVMNEKELDGNSLSFLQLQVLLEQLQNQRGREFMSSLAIPLWSLKGQEMLNGVHWIRLKEISLYSSTRLGDQLTSCC